MEPQEPFLRCHLPARAGQNTGSRAGGNVPGLQTPCAVLQCAMGTLKVLNGKNADCYTSSTFAGGGSHAPVTACTCVRRVSPPYRLLLHHDHCCSTTAALQLLLPYHHDTHITQTHINKRLKKEIYKREEEALNGSVNP
jgi:hypothetical protein